jgi:frataxin
MLLPNHLGCHHHRSPLNFTSTPVATMSMKHLYRTSGQAVRRSLRPVRAQAPCNCIVPRSSTTAAAHRSIVTPATTLRTFHSSSSFRTSISGAGGPPNKESEGVERPTVPTDIPTSEYNQRADEFLEDLVTRLEHMQATRPDLDVEYSVCNRDLHAAIFDPLIHYVGWSLRS